MRHFIAAGLAGLVLLRAVPAAAQSANFEISPYLGYRFGGALNSGTVNQPTLPTLEDLDFTDGLNLGLSGTVRAHRGVLVEVFGERMSSSLKADSDNQATSPELDVALWYLHAGVNWEVNNSHESQLRPLVGLTIGATLLDPEGDRATEARFSFGLLMGVKYFPGDKFGFRVHGRYLSTYLSEGSNLFQASDGTVYTIPETTYMAQFDISAGVVFPLGGM